MNVLNIIGRDKNLFDKDIIVFQNEINTKKLFPHRIFWLSEELVRLN